MSSPDNKTPATHPKSGGLTVIGAIDRATTPPPPTDVSAPTPSTGQEKSQEKPVEKPQEKGGDGGGESKAPQAESPKKD